MAASAASGTGLTVFDPLQTYSRLGELTLLFLFQIGGVGLMATVTLLAVALGWRVGIRQRTLIAADLNQASQQGAIRLVLQSPLRHRRLSTLGAAVLYRIFARDRRRRRPSTSPSSTPQAPSATPDSIFWGAAWRP